jgi:predicted metal-dependent enzyme (double-stranded beta helix superfamily)
MDKFEILNEIYKWEMEIERLLNCDEDESEEIEEIKKRLVDLKFALVDAE